MPANKYQKALKARRRAWRRIGQLQRELSMTSGAYSRRAIRKQIGDLQSIAKKTYRGSGFNIEAETVKLNQLTGFLEPTKKLPKRMKVKERTNRVFQQQIASASRGEKSVIGKGEVGRFKVKAFYRATQRLWEGVPPEKRNEAIVQKLGVGSLGEAFDVVMKDKSVKKAIGEFTEAVKNGVDTEGTVEEYTSSPPELSFVELLKFIARG